MINLDHLVYRNESSELGTVRTVTLSATEAYATDMSYVLPAKRAELQRAIDENLRRKHWERLYGELYDPLANALRTLRECEPEPPRAHWAVTPHRLAWEEAKANVLKALELVTYRLEGVKREEKQG